MDNILKMSFGLEAELQIVLVPTIYSKQTHNEERVLLTSLDQAVHYHACCTDRTMRIIESNVERIIECISMGSWGNGLCAQRLNAILPSTKGAPRSD